MVLFTQAVNARRGRLGRQAATKSAAQLARLIKETDTINASPFEVKAIINVTKGGFTGWRLEYGRGEDPSEWTLLAEGQNKLEQPDTIYRWDLNELDGERITLRIYLMNGEDFYAEKRVFLTFSLPTPTPEPTPTPTLTPTLAPPTALPTDTPVPATPTESLTPPPTETPSPTPTPTETPVTPSP